MHKFLPPTSSKDKLPDFGTNLYKIDMESWSINQSENPSNCGSFGGTIVGLNSSELIIASDPHLYLYSEKIVVSPKCDLDEKFGFCSLQLAAKTRSSYLCSTPSCGKEIHLKCDKSIRGRFPANKNKLCPTCSNLDPVTWKKIKVIQLRRRV